MYSRNKILYTQNDHVSSLQLQSKSVPCQGNSLMVCYYILNFLQFKWYSIYYVFLCMSPNNIVHSYSLIPNSVVSLTLMVLNLSGFLTQTTNNGFSKKQQHFLRCTVHIKFMYLFISSKAECVHLQYKH